MISRLHRERPRFESGWAHSTPLLTLLTLLVFITGCGGGTDTLTLHAELQNTDITTDTNTTLSVTVTNPAEKPITSTILVAADDEDNVEITYPEESLLTNTLYPGEQIRRVINIHGETRTQRTDYEITVELYNESTLLTTTSETLTVTAE